MVVYAKFPRTFLIPNLIGNCTPDWAIAMKKNDVKHIFFVAETKGSMSSMDLSAIERAKIDCAEKLFNSISTANVKYHKVRDCFCYVGCGFLHLCVLVLCFVCFGCAAGFLWCGGLSFLLLDALSCHFAPFEVF